MPQIYKSQTKPQQKAKSKPSNPSMSPIKQPAEPNSIKNPFKVTKKKQPNNCQLIPQTQTQRATPTTATCYLLPATCYLFPPPTNSSPSNFSLLTPKSFSKFVSRIDRLRMSPNL